MLFVGDDWAEAHHEVEIVDDTGTVLGRRHLPEGVAGIDATFGPCNVPVPEYSVIDTKNRYVEPEVYMRLVELNASVGMKTLVFDKRLWSDDPKVRDAYLGG